MDLIKTGINIGKTIRNVSRLREIVLIFARNGFDEFISLGVTSKIPNFVLPHTDKKIEKEVSEKGDKDWNQVIGRRLRKCFEEMGPAFVKFGQLLSSREDMFDSAFIDEMKILRDKVKSVPFDQVKKAIEKSLDAPMETVFQSVDPVAIGTASIAVVHKAVLLNGTSVVVKVKRPDIARMIETDFSILRFIAIQAEKVSDEIKYLGVSRLVKDFAVSLQNELNFDIEGMNCKRFKATLEKHDGGELFHIPDVYFEYSDEDLLVMEFIDGIPFSNPIEIGKMKEEITEKLTRGTKIFIKTFLQDGFFHADLHGGNFFYLKEGKIGLVDFGLMGSLSRTSRKNFVAIVYALVTYNYENLVYEFLDVAEYEKMPNVESLIADVRDSLAPYVGLTVQQINFSYVLQAVTATLNKHRLFLPREWFVLFRALIALDGVGRSIGVNFNIFEMLESDIQDVLKSSLNKEELIEEGAWAIRDMVSSFKMLPRHLKWYMKEWAKNEYAIEISHKGQEKQFNDIKKSIIFLGFSFLAGVFTISGVIFCNAQEIMTWRSVPILSWIFWIIGIAILGKGFYLIRKI